jgi:hypothetical protein
VESSSTPSRRTVSKNSKAKKSSAAPSDIVGGRSIGPGLNGGAILSSSALEEWTAGNVQHTHRTEKQAAHAGVYSLKPATPSRSYVTLQYV